MLLNAEYTPLVSVGVGPPSAASVDLFPSRTYGPLWILIYVEPFLLFLTLMGHPVDSLLCLPSCYHLDIRGYIDPKSLFSLAMIPTIFQSSIWYKSALPLELLSRLTIIPGKPLYPTLHRPKMVLT